jgi:hypothetical protein
VLANAGVSPGSDAANYAQNALMSATQALPESGPVNCDNAAAALAKAQVAEELLELSQNKTTLAGLPLAARDQIAAILDSYQRSIAELSRADAAHRTTAAPKAEVVPRPSVPALPRVIPLSQ